MKSKVVNVIDKDDAVMMMMLLRGTPEKYVLQKAQKASRDHSAYFDYMQILVPRLRLSSPRDSNFICTEKLLLFSPRDV